MACTAHRRTCCARAAKSSDGGCSPWPRPCCCCSCWRRHGTPPSPLRSISRAGVARLCPRRVCVGVWVLPVRSVPPPTMALGRAGAPIAPPRHHGLDGTAVRSEAEGDTPPVPLLYPSASSPSAQRYRPCRPACPLAGPPAVRPAPHTRAPRPTPRPARRARPPTSQGALAPGDRGGPRYLPRHRPQPRRAARKA